MDRIPSRRGRLQGNVEARLLQETVHAIKQDVAWHRHQAPTIEVCLLEDLSANLWHDVSREGAEGASVWSGRSHYRGKSNGKRCPLLKTLK
jgi:hypothetical protein